MAMSLFAGTRNGSVQTEVFDQIGKALPGQLYSASDFNMADAYASVESSSEGLICGHGCILHYNTSIVPGINGFSVRTPKTGDTAVAFAGVVVRTASTNSNALGQAAVDEGQMATVLRNVRAGGRIWLRCDRGLPEQGSAVFMVVNSADPDTLQNGAFVSAAISNDAIEIPNMVWRSSGDTGDLCLVEMMG